MIDRDDALYARLKLWTDRNHNGVSDPGEIKSLSDGNIVAIAPRYSMPQPPKVVGSTGNVILCTGTVYISKRGVDFPRPIGHVQLAR
jgi:hypothetical protein